MRLKHGAHAAGRDPGVANIPRGVLEMWPHLGQISLDLNRHLAALSAGDIVDVNLSELLVDDSARPRAGRHNVLARVLDELADRLALRIVTEERHAAVTV